MSRSPLIPITSWLLWIASSVCGQVLALEKEMVALPEGNNAIGILEDNETYLQLSFIGWGPKWQYLGFRGQTTEADRESRLNSSAKVRASGATVTYDVVVRKTAARRLRMDIDVRTDRDTELTYLIASLDIPPKAFVRGKALVPQDDGEARAVSLPLGRKGVGKQVSRFTLVDTADRETTISLDPACDVGSDGAARIVLVGQNFRADQPRKLTMTVDLPADLTYYPGSKSLPSEPGSDQWYTFKPSQDYDKPSEIGMADWIDAPAGKHGRMVREGDHLIYDGKAIKLWGVNVCYGSCAPDKKLADKRAKLYPKYGINSVRLHKYADGPGWAGIQSKESFAEFDRDGLDRMDYFIAKLKEAGVFVKLSAHFGSIKAGPADRRDVPYLEELGNFDKRRKRITAPHSAFFYSPELQNLSIRQTLNLLRHRNPYTGATYAEDPAICVIEIINEQSILFYTSMAPLKSSATLRQQTAKRFCEWLKARYGNHEALSEAWGKQAFDSFTSEGFKRVGEHLDAQNILPIGNPWFWDPEQLSGSQAFRRQRLLDTLEFLYSLQCEAYGRYVSAVREAGYTGEILGSNWQAGRAFSHYYNLHSDYRVGMIDRHNYFGGGRGGKINSATMLRVPGSGMLSAGMQQVADRPFMLSEWIHVFPNEWGVEGPAIIGAYAMGLQGWDVSYMFQNRDNGGFGERIGRDRWEVSTPPVLGIFPAVARQVLRGDVRESQVLASRYVHLPSLHAGKLGFEDRVTQAYDVKAFNCDKVPARTLAVARCVVEFTDEYRETPIFDISKYAQDGAYVSSTGQLRWQEGASKHDGFFTIDTDATKAVVGFAKGRTCELSDFTITPKCRFAAIYVTAKERDRTIATSSNLLIVAIARSRNTGMKVFNGCRLLDRGKPPIVMEPVQATISVRKPGAPELYVLDHDGCRTGATLPINDGTFEIDGARDRTCYYLLAY